MQDLKLDDGVVLDHAAIGLKGEPLPAFWPALKRISFGMHMVCEF